MTQTKSFFGGRVPKLSPRHLFKLAPEHEFTLFDALEQKGLVTDKEYECRQKEGCVNLDRCSRYCIESYKILENMNDAKEEVKIFSPVVGTCYVHDLAGDMDKVNSFYRPLGDSSRVGWDRVVSVVGVGDQTQRIANDPLRHAVTIFGFGRCVRGEEEYFIIQNTYETKGIPFGERSR